MLEFQFWNGKSYQSYEFSDQQFFMQSMQQVPRQSDLHFPNGRYILQGFDRVEFGHCHQVNCQTGFQRWVRIKPPYRLPGAQEAKLPTGEFHFQYEDGDWKPYSQDMQEELVKLARSAPPPEVCFFVTAGQPYCLLGFETMFTDNDQHTQQVNLKSDRIREVKLVQGPPTPPTFSMSSRGLPAASSKGFGKGFKSKRGAPLPTPKTGSFSLLSAVSIYGRSERSAGERPVKLEPKDVAELIGHWKSPSHQQQVHLSSGQTVENIQALASGGARLLVAGATSWCLEMKLVPPVDGAIQLPAELDEDQTIEMNSIGEYLAHRDIAKLSARGSEAAECAICLCPVEPSAVPNGGAQGSEVSNPGMSSSNENCMFSNAPNSASSNQVAAVGGPVFALRCGHAYHTDCLQRWFSERRRCPRCLQDFGKMVGKQPRNGTLTWHMERHPLDGVFDAKQTIVIEFHFPRGLDDDGKPFDGRNPRGYLPCNTQGILLLELFKVAFKRRVMFGLGTSMSFGSYRPTFNIHIKTSTRGGATKHGYPDPDYFARALDELKTNGVTFADLQ